jgi:hypothetical protein
VASNRSSEATTFPVRVENVVIASCSGRDCPRGTMVVPVTILVPSGVMSVFPGLKVMTPARFGNVTTSLADRRLPPGAVVSRTRTCAVPWNFPPHCWNASFRPSAVHENGWPNGLKFPAQPPTGSIHSLFAPVASVMTWIDRRKLRASLLPSGESPMPPTCAASSLSGRATAVSVAVP